MTETKRRIETTRRPPEPYETGAELYFDEPPRIANRSDALYLLDRMIEAKTMTYHDVTLEALKDAIERGIV